MAQVGTSVDLKASLRVTKSVSEEANTKGHHHLGGSEGFREEGLACISSKSSLRWYKIDTRVYILNGYSHESAKVSHGGAVTKKEE